MKCLSYIPSKDNVCENQFKCIHINKECPKQEYLKACYPDAKELLTVDIIKKYCKICEKETESKVEQIEEEYEYNGYYGEKLVDYYFCQECHCPTERV